MKKHLNLIPVIMCGGSGTRLWPLSRKNLPKQFISMPAKNDETTTDNLFRQTLIRAGLFDPEFVVIVCNEAHRFHVADNIYGFPDTEFTILVEAVSRNTAPAAALAALDIQARHEDALMLVLPSDHRIVDSAGFSRAVRTAVQAAELNKLVTFGIVPDRPETGYGYIRRGEPIAGGDQRSGQKIYGVSSFREKPDVDTARRWLEEGGYYWNSGMFLFKASNYLQQLQVHAPEVYSACIQGYAQRRPDLRFIRIDHDGFEKSPDISIDYAVMERSMEVALVAAEFDWDDVGSWDALSLLFASDDRDNRAIGETLLIDSSNNVVCAQSRLVSMVGMEDCIVVETPDAVLVAQRSNAQGIKRVVGELRKRRFLQADEHRKVYRPWGTYESIDMGGGFQVKRIIVNPKRSLSLQLHHHRSEHWVVVRGEVQVSCGEERFMLSANESTYIPKRTKHRLENLGEEPAHLIEVQCGDYLGEDDIVRFEDDYGRSGQKQ